MKNFFISFAIFIALIFTVSCGGSSKNTNTNPGTSSTVCEYGEYECHGGDSYFCGYSGDDLDWVLSEECSNGCYDMTGKCNSDSNGSSDTEPDDSDTTPEEPDNGDSTPVPDEDDTDTATPDQDDDTADSDDDEDDDTADSDDDDDTADSDDDDDLPVERDEGIYLGIIGFNQTIPQKTFPITKLDDNVAKYSDFINDLEKADGTALYFAEYNALNMLEAYNDPIPPKLKKVALVTFTDGLDNTSTSNQAYDPDNYSEGGKSEKYRDAIYNRIKNTPIHGQNVVAYSVGLQGSDVTDLSKFQETLKKLASRDRNALRVENMDEVKEKFKKIADELYSEAITKNIDVKVPGGYDDGQELRFTFDIHCDNSGVCNNNAAYSTLYIDATYVKPNFEERSLKNITYHGLAENNTYITGSKDPNDSYFHFVFKGLKYYEKNKVPVSEGSEEENKNDQALNAGAITENQSQYIIENIDDILAAVEARKTPIPSVQYQLDGEGNQIPVEEGSTDATKNNQALNAGAISSTQAQYVISNIDNILAVVEIRNTTIPSPVFQYEDGNTPLSAEHINNIQLWLKNNDVLEKESEFKPASSTSVSEEKSSALIMLVLDCTTSLGDNDFAKMKNAADDFVTVLNGETTSSTQTLPACTASSGTPCKDSTSGLIWSGIDTVGRSWSDAQYFCSTYSEGGLTGWHLPTISELRTLIKNCAGTKMPGGSCGVRDDDVICLDESCWTSSYCNSCSSETSHSKFDENFWLWSSSVYGNDSNYAWYVGFDTATVSRYSKSNSGGYLRCVK